MGTTQARERRLTSPSSPNTRVTVKHGCRGTQRGGRRAGVRWSLRDSTPGRRAVNDGQKQASDIWASVNSAAAAAAKGTWEGIKPVKKVLWSDVFYSPKREAFLRKWQNTDTTTSTATPPRTPTPLTRASGGPTAAGSSTTR